MKVIIDVPENTYEAMQNEATLCTGHRNGKNLLSTLWKSVVNGIPLPDNATNGDVIKALFPNAEFDNKAPFTDGRWETMRLNDDEYKPTQLRTYQDWWNAPYKGAEE